MILADSQAAPDFVLFGAGHLAVLALSLVLGLAVALYVRRFGGLGRRRIERTTCAALGAFLLGSAAFSNVYWLTSGKWSVQWSVPLQLCDFALLLSAAMLLRIAIRGRPPLQPREPGWRPGWQFVYELIYFWTLGGTTQAMLTPNLNTPFPHPETIRFYTSHGGTFVAAMLLTAGMSFRPRPGSWWRVWLFTNALVPPVMLFDWAAGANYMFLMGPPENPSVIDYLGPWPWMVAALSATALAIMMLLYLPWWWLDRRREPAVRH